MMLNLILRTCGRRDRFQLHLSLVICATIMGSSGSNCVVIVDIGGRFGFNLCV